MFVAFACVAKFVYISYDDRLENVYVWSRQSRVAAVLFFVRGPSHFHLEFSVRKPNRSNSETFENRGLTVRKSYSFVQQRFGVLTEFDLMSDEDIKIAIERLFDIYLKDLSFEFYSEYSVSLFADTRNSQKIQQKKDKRHCSTYFQFVANK